MVRDDDSILEVGETVWRLETAERLAALVDADAYFSAVVSCIRQARRQLFIIGWDIDSRVQLVPRAQGDERPPVILSQLLREVLEQRPELEVYMLIWDFSPIYTFERELLTRFKLAWTIPRGLHFHFDSRHPPGGSHHQKLVVVDDSVAFVGGIDLTSHRWDTPAHLPDDDRRLTTDGEPYGPYHDLQLALGGPAARSLAELARQRWAEATDQQLAPPAEEELAGSEVWPEGLEPQQRDVRVGIVRSRPASAERAAVRETERLLRRALRSARRHVYIETQYLSSAAISGVICERLREEHGPDIVVVTPREVKGWLEQGTMGVVRTRVFRELARADLHQRLRILSPVLPGGLDVYVHSKLLIVDDQVAYIGSANLTNRSLGLDTECGIALGRVGGEAARRFLVELRNHLLAEHLDVQPQEVAAAVQREGSLSAAVDALRKEQGRTLIPFEDGLPEWLDELVPGSTLLDAGRPYGADEVLRQLLPPESMERIQVVDRPVGSPEAQQEREEARAEEAGSLALNGAARERGGGGGGGPPSRTNRQRAPVAELAALEERQVRVETGKLTAGVASGEVDAIEHAAAPEGMAATGARPVAGLPAAPAAETAEAVAAAAISEQQVDEEEEAARRRKVTTLGGIGLLLFVVGMLVVWKWTPLARLVAPEQLALWAEPWKGETWAVLIVVAAYVAGGLLVLPLNLLLLATVLGFGPLVGALYGYLGALVSAVATFLIGRSLGRASLERHLGPRVRRIARRIGHHGLVTVVLLRVTPVAPYTIVNLVAGASPISFLNYLVGTAIGLLPGLLAMALLGGSLEEALRRPGALAYLVLVLVLVLLIIGFALLNRRLRARSRRTR